MKSRIKGCTHHSSKVISKFREGGGVGGIGGGSGVDGSGNRGNGGFGGGTSGQQGGGGLGGGGKDGVNGTGLKTGNITGTTVRGPSGGWANGYGPRAITKANSTLPASKPPTIKNPPAKKPATPPAKKKGLSFTYNYQYTPGYSYGNYMRNPTQRPYDVNTSPGPGGTYYKNSNESGGYGGGSTHYKSNYRKGGMVKRKSPNG